MYKKVFKEMGKEMTDEEIEKCMAILLEGSIITEIRRDTIQNAIDITFELMGDSKKGIYHVSLLPDSIDDLTVELQYRLRPSGLYLYEQFMIAKGYSEYLKDNVFME